MELTRIESSGSDIAPHAGTDDSQFSDPGATSKRELLGWYIFDWSNSVYSTVIISGFLPLLLQSTALEAAGFPGSCLNVVSNVSAVQAIFPTATQMYRTNEPPSGGCGSGDSCRLGYCEGVPDVVSQCRSLDGTTVTRPTVHMGFAVDPTAYASTFIGISVLFQVFVFVSISALADFGRLRKRLLMITSTGGALTSIMTVFVFKETWWLGGILTIISNVFYGSTFIFYNAYLPLLTASHPDVLAASATDRVEVSRKTEEGISARGFAAGYCGAVMLLLVSIGTSFAVEGAGAYRINIALAGTWWLFFSMFTFLWLKERPGPALPANAGNSIAFSWRRARRTLSHIRQLPETFKVLVCWFFYSDGFNVISSLGALFANSEANWGCFPKSLGLALLFAEIPIFAAVGCFLTDYLVSRFSIQGKHVIVGIIFTYFGLCAYAAIGFFSTTIGLRQGWELFVFGFVYGIGLGAIQSYSRALFSSLIPPGMEGEFFGFFEMTDKGSSWMGPLAIGIVQQVTGNIRYGLVYIVLMMATPVPFLLSVDIVKGKREAQQHAIVNRREDKRDLGQPTTPSPAVETVDVRKAEVREA